MKWITFGLIRKIKHKVTNNNKRHNIIFNLLNGNSKTMHKKCISVFIVFCNTKCSLQYIIFVQVCCDIHIFMSFITCVFFISVEGQNVKLKALINPFSSFGPLKHFVYCRTITCVDVYRGHLSSSFTRGSWSLSVFFLFKTIIVNRHLCRHSESVSTIYFMTKLSLGDSISWSLNTVKKKKTY